MAVLLRRASGGRCVRLAGASMHGEWDRPLLAASGDAMAVQTMRPRSGYTLHEAGAGDAEKGTTAGWVRSMPWGGWVRLLDVDQVYARGVAKVTRVGHGRPTDRCHHAGQYAIGAKNVMTQTTVWTVGRL